MELITELHSKTAVSQKLIWSYTTRRPCNMYFACVTSQCINFFIFPYKYLFIPSASHTHVCLFLFQGSIWIIRHISEHGFFMLCPDGAKSQCITLFFQNKKVLLRPWKLSKYGRGSLRERTECDLFGLSVLRVPINSSVGFRISFALKAAQVRRCRLPSFCSG